MTAIQVLEQAALDPGERLLVNGAGGVGSAIQVGRAWGAAVSGVSSSGGAALVAGLGARAIDYTRGELEMLEESFDVIFDTVFSHLRRSRVIVGAADDERGA